MAILKDLIVNGSSRFLNKTYFSSIRADTVDAEEGIFKKLIATDANLTNATVVGLLDVQGEMHTNSWSNSNIATIDGNFYITPTAVSADGTDTTASGYTPTGTITYSNTNYTQMTITGTFDTSQLTLDGTSSIAWSANSYVIVTGDVLVGNEWYPLGTIRGKLSAQVAANTSSKTFTIIPIGTQIISGEVGNVSLTDGNGHKPLTLEAIRTAGATLTSLKLRKVKISMTSRGSGSDQYALGIYMTAMGGNKKTFLDIYGGSNKNGVDISSTIGGTTYQSGAFAKPTVRIGNLLGLPAIQGITPTGWGIYTTNGFFSGTVVARQGKIGDGETAWTIGSGSGTGSVSYIYAPTNGPKSKTAQTVGMYIGTDGINNFQTTGQYVRIYDGKIYAQGADIAGEIKADTGRIGGTSGWTIASQQLYSGTIGADNSLHLGTKNLGNNTSIGGRQGSDWRLTVGQHFGVTNTGALYCNDIHATGGTIGGFKIDTTSIRTNDVAVTSNADNSISLSSTDFTRTISGTSRAGLRFAIGDKFGVTGDGAIYASSATISGAITATSGSFTGGILLNGGYLTTNSSRTTYNSTSATGITIDKNGIGGYTSANAYFNMTIGGVLTAVGATVTGTVNATTGTFGNATNKITLGTGTSGHSSLRYGMTTLADTTNNGFYVGTDGIALGKGAFKVTSDGTLTATSATIKGQINATSGFIGQNETNGFKISSSAIFNPSTKSTLDSDTIDGIYVGKDGIALGKGTFKVDDTGYMTSISGEIGGWGINDKTLHSSYEEDGMNYEVSINSSTAGIEGTSWYTEDNITYTRTISLSPINGGLFVSSEMGYQSYVTGDTISVTNASNVICAIMDENGIRASNLGTTWSESKTVNITSTNVDVYVEGPTITLPAGGVYILHAFATFTSNSTEAIRRVQLYNKTSGAALRANSEWGKYYVTGTIMDSFRIGGTVAQTYSARVSAGVAISGVGVYLKAVRIA